MEKRILQKLAENTSILKKQGKTLDVHTKILERQAKILERQAKILESHTKILEEHSKRFDDHDQKFDRVFNKLLDHDQQLKDIKETMATKDDMRELAINMDKILGLHVKHEAEMLFMGQRVSRQEEDIRRIKTVVKLA